MEGKELLDKIRNSTVSDDWFELQKELLLYIKNPNSSPEMVEKLKGYAEMIAMICDGLDRP